MEKLSKSEDLLIISNSIKRIAIKDLLRIELPEAVGFQ